MASIQLTRWRRKRIVYKRKPSLKGPRNEVEVEDVKRKGSINLPMPKIINFSLLLFARSFSVSRVEGKKRSGVASVEKSQIIMRYLSFSFTSPDFFFGVNRDIGNEVCVSAAQQFIFIPGNDILGVTWPFASLHKLPARASCSISSSSCFPMNPTSRTAIVPRVMFRKHPDMKTHQSPPVAG